MTAEEFRLKQRRLGLTNSQLASEMGLALRTVEAYRSGSRRVTAHSATTLQLLIDRQSTILIETCLVCGRHYRVKSADGAPGGESHGICDDPDCLAEWEKKFW